VLVELAVATQPTAGTTKVNLKPIFISLLYILCDKTKKVVSLCKFDVLVEIENDLFLKQRKLPN
jgi:hypothetical protein